MESLALTRDGREVPLVKDGKAVYNMTDTLSACEVLITWQSLIRPVASVGEV